MLNELQSMNNYWTVTFPIRIRSQSRGWNFTNQAFKRKTDMNDSGGERMIKEHRLLLIGSLRDDPWKRIIQEVWATLGTLHITEETNALRLVQEQDYDLIIIDASNVEMEVGMLISSIRNRKSDARIIVATASPTWERARQAFRAGATDYVGKSMNKRKVLSNLQAIIDKSPPVWSCYNFQEHKS